MATIESDNDICSHFGNCTSDTYNEIRKSENCVTWPWYLTDAIDTIDT